MMLEGRPCGSTARSSDRWSRSELLERIKRDNIEVDPSATLTELCEAVISSGAPSGSLGLPKYRMIPKQMRQSVQKRQPGEPGELRIRGFATTGLDLSEIEQMYSHERKLLRQAAQLAQQRQMTETPVVAYERAYERARTQAREQALARETGQLRAEARNQRLAALRARAKFQPIHLTFLEVPVTISFVECQKQPPDTSLCYWFSVYGLYNAFLHADVPMPASCGLPSGGDWASVSRTIATIARENGGAPPEIWYLSHTDYSHVPTEFRLKEHEFGKFPDRDLTDDPRAFARSVKKIVLDGSGKVLAIFENAKAGETGHFVSVSFEMSAGTLEVKVCDTANFPRRKQIGEAVAGMLKFVEGVSR
ncbi:MAG: hypothetical protein ACYCOU_05780 [Sulfobacillus sp.]